MGIEYSQISLEPDNNTDTKVSQPTSSIDEKTALNLVWQLPQVKRKAREIQRLSKGTIRVAAMVDGLPTPETPYYTIRVIENHVDHIDTIYLFRVLNPSKAIQVYDILKDEYIPLPEWKPN
ncbi:hypothetical protein [Calothrix sp. NIES-2098]|uniref:hypothetical protein n=1 Tax=Calothrix sp. NIES-2098 TaxID=1954171 RepID=UPI0030D99EAA